MEERARILIANLVEIIRENRDDLYNEEFAKYLEEKAGITPEELVECGIYEEAV